MAAFSHDSGSCCRINRAIFAQLIGPTENTILFPRDDIHEWRVITNHGREEIVFWDDCDLAAMRFEIDVLDQVSRTDSSAVHNEIELRINLFQLGKTLRCLDFAACVAETLREI